MHLVGLLRSLKKAGNNRNVVGQHMTFLEKQTHLTLLIVVGVVSSVIFVAAVVVVVHQNTTNSCCVLLDLTHRLVVGVLFGHKLPHTNKQTNGHLSRSHHNLLFSSASRMWFAFVAC